jgi:FdrA protein
MKRSPFASGSQNPIACSIDREAWVEHNKSSMETTHHTEPDNLLAAPPRVVNVGLELFAVNLVSQGAEVVHVQWRPPAGGISHLIGLLEKLRS